MGSLGIVVPKYFHEGPDHLVGAFVMPEVVSLV